MTKIRADNIQLDTLITIATPKISSIIYSGDDLATAPAGGQTITLSGSGFVSGCQVLVDSTYASVVSFVSSTTLTFVAPAKAVGTYTLYVINPDGGTGITIPGLSYSLTPVFGTAAGTLGTAFETTAFNTTIAATGDGAITYSVLSGTLPGGLGLDANTGVVSGTLSTVSTATTYTFTIRATDVDLQDADRTFSVTVDPDTVTFNTPADGTTYTNLTGDVFSLTLNATSVMGKTIAYTANVLPGGLSIVGSAITGTFSAAATTSSQITATAADTLKTATRLLNWTVTEPPPQYQPFGWFGGGGPGPGPRSIVSRITFASDTSAASTRGPLSTGKYALAATGNGSYGWFGGGRQSFQGTTSDFSRVDRIDYAADTSTAGVRGNLTGAKYLLSATGNDNFGWFAGSPGGLPGASNSNRISYVTDTATASIRGSLGSARYASAASGNANYAWFGGGRVSGFGDVSSTVRIDYSADTTTASTRGALSAARSYLASTGNSNYGWWGGGYRSGAGSQGTSTVDRIDYGSDTSIASVRGPIPPIYTGFGMRDQSATGDENYGWFGGGYQGYLFRINYSSDTVNLSDRSPARIYGYNSAATGGFTG